MTEPVPGLRHRGKSIGRIAGVLIIAAIVVVAVWPSLKRGSAPKPAAVDSTAPAPPAVAAPAQPADTSAAPPSVVADTIHRAEGDTLITSPILVLEPDGLGYLIDWSSVRHMNFGTDSARIHTAVTAMLGAGKSVPVPACGAERVEVKYGGFSIFLDGDRFVGWSDRTGKACMLNGTGVGMTLAELRKSERDVTVRGTEWSAGDMGGTLDGTGDASRVTEIHVGETCGGG